MKKLPFRTAGALLLLWVTAQSVSAADLLIPVGQVVGLELGNKTVTVADFDDRLGDAAREAGLQVGDRITAIDDSPIENVQDIHRALERSDGTVEVQISRDGHAHSLRIDPAITADGPKLGLYLKQGITGIGTVTYYDPEDHSFGVLGHGVNDPSGKLLQLAQGSAYPASVVSVRKGVCGEPGQLLGSLTGAEPIGNLHRNTVQGVFGNSDTGWSGKALPVAESEEVRTGSATILSTIAGTEVREYSVEILKTYPSGREAGRNMLIKVTDPALLEATGGIVQGMSGSPIIQDGKLVGAVTHVLVNDPSTGYGIFIENMLDAAS